MHQREGRIPWPLNVESIQRMSLPERRLVNLPDDPNLQPNYLLLATTSPSSVFGTMYGWTRFLTSVLCSYAYASEISLASLNAGPRKLRPNLYATSQYRCHPSCLDCTRLTGHLVRRRQGPAEVGS